MDYHLKPIEQFVTYYLKSQNSFVDNIDQLFIAKLLDQIDNELKKIRVFISESFYSFDEEKASVFFIRNHQRRIITIINQMGDNLADKTDDPEVISVLRQELSSRLMDLLKFLEQDYVHCLDPDMNITKAYGKKKAFEFLRIISEFHNSFYRCDSLMEIALEPIYTFTRSDQTSYSYKRVRYLHRMIKELERLSKSECIGVKNSLVDILLLINFNNDAYYNYLTNLIKTDIDRLEPIQKKIQKLKYHLKRFKQKNTKHDISFLPNRENIKDQVVSWIIEEISYTESLPATADDSKTACPEDKITLGVSADELALLIKIGMESELIHVDQLTPFTRFIAYHFSTKKQKKISAKSLRNRIYKIVLKDPLGLKVDLLTVLNKYM